MICVAFMQYLKEHIGQRALEKIKSFLEKAPYIICSHQVQQAGYNKKKLNIFSCSLYHFAISSISIGSISPAAAAAASPVTPSECQGIFPETSYC